MLILVVRVRGPPSFHGGQQSNEPSEEPMNPSPSARPREPPNDHKLDQGTVS